MTIEELFSFIESFTNLERTPGTSMRPYRLDRMGRLLELFDHPHRSSRVVHLAGSKGKGSTGAFTAKCLEAANYTVGLYTSPHVSSYKERITLAGREIEDEVFFDAYRELRLRIPDRTVPGLAGQPSPTTFELLTLLAFLAFRRIGCDWTVIETGIGGRLDATNLVDPEAVVITPIELEHTEVLGDTLDRIAWEKAGIIKPGAKTYIGYLHPEAETVIVKRAEELGSPVTALGKELDAIEYLSVHPKTRVRYLMKDRDETFDLGMDGAVQAENAALASLVCRDILKEAGFDDRRMLEALRTGLAGAHLPGRMEVVDGVPPVVLDAAHTPSSIRRLVDALVERYTSPRYLLFGSVTGKRHEEMAALLAPHFDRIVVSTPGTFKPSDPRQVHESFTRLHPRAELVADPEEALDRLLHADPTPTAVLVTGSFYMIAEARKVLRADHS